MARALLQKMLDGLPFATLPPTWTTFDLARLLSCPAAVSVPAALHAQALVIAESKSQAPVPALSKTTLGGPCETTG